MARVSDEAVEAYLKAGHTQVEAAAHFGIHERTVRKKLVALTTRRAAEQEAAQRAAERAQRLAEERAYTESLLRAQRAEAARTPRPYDELGTLNWGDDLSDETEWIYIDLVDPDQIKPYQWPVVTPQETPPEPPQPVWTRFKVWHAEQHRRWKQSGRDRVLQGMHTAVFIGGMIAVLLWLLLISTGPVGP